MSETASLSLLQLTAHIVAAHVAHNVVRAEDLPAMIAGVYQALARAAPAAVLEPRAEPAVPVKRSVFPDHIICLEDGQDHQMLKRHLLAAHDMTPEQYRRKWGLPATYPMVAPEYSKRRSALAKTFGFGRNRGTPASSEATAKPAARGRRGRKSAPAPL